MGFFSTNHFDLGSMPDLSDKVALVTGGNTGLGYATCLELARKNAQVFMACRNEKKALEAIECIKIETKNQRVEYLSLDLADSKSVVKMVKAFLDRDLPLNILILNAGYMANPFIADTFTTAGVETHFAINVCGHFQLTRLLTSTLVDSAPARVVVLSSVAHYMILPGGIQYDRIHTGLTPGTAYGQSKLGNILLCKALAKRLEGKRVFVNAVHPGTANTDLFRDMTSIPLLGGLLSHLFYYTTTTAADGALTSLYCAASDEIEENGYSGEYFVPHGQLSTPSKIAQDPIEAEKLWDFVEKLVDRQIA
ncbi:hypothetical protein K7432_006616 [Basidiobolus ranarum]|uniref:NAD(P)-binding protein n=1 Tax=Basidiobolus ranarum TaxID=34480 RepID=A0ABR2WUL2_9FUNG